MPRENYQAVENLLLHAFGKPKFGPSETTDGGKLGGDHVKARRLALHLFQSDIAKLLHVDKGSVRNWERNVYRPNPQFLPRIHAFLGYVP